MNDTNDIQRRQELAHFLRMRRERILPEAVGLSVGARRRTPGLRREELAQLAGIGLTWYTRLEQGKDIIVSPQVIESLARIFDLNAAERQYLFVLAREQVPADPHPFTSQMSPQLQSVLDTMGNTPAYIINLRWDIVGWNQAMGHVFSDLAVFALHERNILRSLFTNPLQRSVLHDWEKEAKATLAQFRASTDRYVREPWFKALVGELQQTSLEFREWWPRHDIQSVCSARKELDHPLVGLLVLQSSTFQVVDAPDLRMVIFTAAEAETARKLIRLVEQTELQPAGSGL
ncbi:MAG TPA: helix-turn-helix transcriptional regulator [Ktedonobacteraceae bacterium]|nr:helix-turn-helix transcriptional regulator [Ktedonobacteraceae bacterium]